MNRLDLIIDALDLATETSEFERINTLYKQALAAARELKALKPVAWMYINEDDECEQIEFGQPHEDDMSFTTPLYALDEDTK
jgi:hypothetical protein